MMFGDYYEAVKTSLEVLVDFSGRTKMTLGICQLLTHALPNNRLPFFNAIHYSSYSKAFAKHKFREW